MRLPRFNSMMPKNTVDSKDLTISKDETDSKTETINLLDTFFPGVSFFLVFLRRYFKKFRPGLDLRSFILTLGIGLFFFRYAKLAVHNYLWSFIEQYFMSQAIILEGDEVYNIVMAWIGKQPFTQDSRLFQVSTGVPHHNGSRQVITYVGGDRERVKIKDDDFTYFPTFGKYFFWHKGRAFFFERSMDSNSKSRDQKSEQISLSTIGRSPASLKLLLDECKADFLKEEEQTTAIYRAGGNRPGGRSMATWSRATRRISRPFSTVVLDAKVKKSVIKDLKDYLNSDQERWYSNRGIPYRRGYLLHGPPGTGKSSLSFAIAGYFKLRIYVVSLNSTSMDEEKLESLFSLLPSKCVVLLEDIDSAGLTHERTQVSDDKTDNLKGKISLSGLLNVIDGVASKEGRVLIMTTNHLEKLDPALIRPGRIDMTVKFGLAGEDQITQIFEGIYATLEGDAPPSGTVKEKNGWDDGDSNADADSEDEDEEEKRRRKTTSGLLVASDDVEYRTRISDLAKSFAAKIPSGEFSPAEIQGYLLRWKNAPDVAVERAAEWVVEIRASKTAEDSGVKDQGAQVEVKDQEEPTSSGS